MRDVRDNMVYRNIDYGKNSNEIKRGFTRMIKEMLKFLYDVRKEHLSHMSSHMTVVCTSF